MRNWDHPLCLNVPHKHNELSSCLKIRRVQIGGFGQAIVMVNLENNDFHRSFRKKDFL